MADPSQPIESDDALSETPETEDPTAELERLRELLVGEERRDLARLERRFDDWELTPEEVAELLPDAVAQATGDDERLAKALAPTLEAGIAESVHRNPQQITQAIYPILGPAIRKAISDTLSGFVETLNRAIEHSFSRRGLAWRWEAWRTGVPYAEIVLKRALVYRVEQVFLIHGETGLLLAHAALDESKSRDPDLVSGMLTAIRDFVADSF
ncbi:MAG: OmpA family protein, partial [Thermoanaerobaculia bacterium]|nr:OmpA family protein [Thermoanaerobaculia bacterium]